MADASDDLGIPMKPARPWARGRAGAQWPGKAPDDAAARARSGARRRDDAIRPAEPIRRPGEPATQPRRSDGEVRKLTVGREITLSGEITSCDKLIIEGSVEANLNNCRDVEIAETGLFKGYRLDRGSRDPGPFRRQSGGSQAASDKGERAGVGHDPLRPDRNRVRRPDLRGCPSPALSRARRVHARRGERARS